MQHQQFNHNKSVLISHRMKHDLASRPSVFRQAVCSILWPSICVSVLYHVSRDGVPYCETHYHAQFGVKCETCCRYISGRVLEVRMEMRDWQGKQEISGRIAWSYKQEGRMDLTERRAYCRTDWRWRWLYNDWFIVLCQSRWSVYPKWQQWICVIGVPDIFLKTTKATKIDSDQIFFVTATKIIYVIYNEILPRSLKC